MYMIKQEEMIFCFSFLILAIFVHPVYFLLHF